MNNFSAHQKEIFLRIKSITTFLGEIWPLKHGNILLGHPVCTVLKTITFQEVDGSSYTNIKDSNFDCGRYKTYCEIQEDCTEEFLTQGIDGKPRNVSYEGWGNENEETPGCSTTLINDKFALSAAHCYKEFGSPKDLKDGYREGRGITVR